MIELTQEVLLAFIAGCAVGSVFTAALIGWVIGKAVAHMGQELPETVSDRGEPES